MPLKLEEIRFAYPGKEVLKGIETEIDDGEIRVVFGPNGSGKSTLLKIIAGLLTPHDGRVMVGDKDVTHLPPERRNVGYVPQDSSLFPHLTVEENIRYSERHGRGSEELFERLVDMLDLEDHLNLKPSELSGGYATRVALARALFSEPEVMLLDEPLSDVDLAAKAEIIPEMRKVLKDFGAPALYVTHDPWEAERMGDTFEVMVNGGTVRVSDVEEALEVLRTGGAEVARE